LSYAASAEGRALESRTADRWYEACPTCLVGLAKSFDRHDADGCRRAHRCGKDLRGASCARIRAFVSGRLGR
jgi:hypothetical protein